MPPNPTDIITRVSQQDTDTSLLRTRMDDDYRKRWMLEPYNAGAGFKSYTSPHTRSFASKIISLLASANLDIRIPTITDPREERAQSNNKERYLRGALLANDERLARLGQSPLQSQLAWHTAIRGWFCGRALLVKQKDGREYHDITAFDPRHFYFEADSNGLTWGCYRSRRRKRDVGLEYQRNYNGSGGDEVWVYDYYDREGNLAFIENNETLKPFTPHGMPDQAPIFFGAVGEAPFIYDVGQSIDYSTYGESIFAECRVITDNINLMLSILLELAARSRKPPMGVSSAGGTKGLQEDPYKEGTVLQLDSNTGEKVEAIPFFREAPQLMPYFTYLIGELQRATLPFSVFGETAVPLSGYAIDTLNRMMGTKTRPVAQSIERAYRQICNLLTAHFTTGAFNPILLSGRGSNQEWFSETIDYRQIIDLPEPEVRLLVQLPKDDAARVQMARMLDEGISPLLPRQVIWEDILQLQDPDQIADMLLEQQGEKLLPQAMLQTMVTGLSRRGRSDLAQVYFTEWLKQMAQQQLMLQQMGLGALVGGLPTGDVNQTTVGQPTSSVLPNRGGQPNPPAGGTAPTAEERLNAIGLFPPGG